MPNSSKLAVVLEMLESAQSSIRSAKAMIAELAGASPDMTSPTRPLNPVESTAGGRIIEGVFDGQNMRGSDNRMYPVPANYASKSKLVQGDVLKLTITETGAFVYKQIGPIKRLNAIGTVAFDDGQYKLLCEGKAYRVLMASITFYRAEVGQQLSILLPEGIDAEWATVDNVVPEGGMPPIVMPDEDESVAPSETTEDAPADVPAEPVAEETPPAKPKRRTRAS